MARRRGQQKGYVHKQGNAWYLAFREDALDANGNIVRIRRNQKIADAKEVSKREAQRLAREILSKVDQQAQRPIFLRRISNHGPRIRLWVGNWVGGLPGGRTSPELRTEVRPLPRPAMRFVTAFTEKDGHNIRQVLVQLSSESWKCCSFARQAWLGIE